MVRAFIAVDVPATPALREASSTLRATAAPLKLVDLDIVHLTLKFLGETPEGRVPQIVEIMRAAASEVPPGRFTLRGMGAFPSPRRVRVVWVGVEPREPLQRVARALEEACARLGYPPENRPFAPHVTLARARVPKSQPSLEKIVEAMKDRDFGEFGVDELALKKSILHPTGPEYQVVAKAPLGQPAG